MYPLVPEALQGEHSVFIFSENAIADTRNEAKSETMVGHGLVWAALSGVFAIEPPVPPDPGTAASLEVFVRCPELSSEASASVEARARADLLAQGIDRGLLVIACVEGVAQAAWMTAGETPRSSRAALPPTERERIEQLVSLAAESATLAERKPKPDGPAPEPPAIPVVPVAGPRASTAAVAVPPPKPPISTLESPEADTNGRDAARPLSSARRRAALVVGPTFELWGTQTIGALGARAGVELPVEQRFAGLPSLTYENSLGSADGVTVRHLFLSVELSGEVTRFLLLSGGVAGSFMIFDGSSAVSPESRISIVPALLGVAAVPLHLTADKKLLFGVGFRAYEADRRVTIDGRRVLHIPVATLCFTADLRFGL